MKSICLSCLLYTLKDKEVKDNLYIDVFFQWLAMVVKNAGLTEHDVIHINMDMRTIEYLENEVSIGATLLKKLNCDYNIYAFEPPQTSLEGMMNKYTFNEYTQDIYIYTDIDMFILKPLRNMVSELNIDTYYFLKGESLDKKFYSEGFPSDFIPPDILTTLPGFNASLFIVTSILLRDNFFSRINELCDYSSEYLCVEQPYFNRAIYEIPRKELHVNIDLLSIYAEFSAFDVNSKVIFLDFCGETSNGLSHFIKMSRIMCLVLVDSLE